MSAGSRHAIGLDLGGSALKWGVVSESGDLVEHGSTPINDRSPERVIDTIGNTLNSILSGLPARPTGVGIGTPGLLDRDRRVVRIAPNFPGWSDIPLLDRMKPYAGGLPIFMENDANLLLFSETLWGGARGVGDLIVLTLGTGVGGGVLCDGNLLIGAGGGAAELGHISLNPDGPLCGCGVKGCLESYCNISGVLRTASGLYTPDFPPATPRELTEAADNGDGRAIETWRQVGRWLGVGLATLINIFNPACILVGGGVSGAGEYLLGPARMEAEKRCYAINWTDVTVKTASFGNLSGTMGAAALVFSKAAVSSIDK